MDVQKEQLYDDEIDLFDLFMRLWRWKKMIIGVTLGCIILVFGIYSFLPKIYLVNAIIEPGVRMSYQNGQTAEEKAIESPALIREKILGGVFDKEIAEKLALKISDIPKIKVKITKDTNLLVISMESHDSKKVLTILSVLISKISDNLQSKINLDKQRIERLVETATEQVVQTRKKIEKLEVSRKAAIGNSPTDSMSVLLYFNEIKEHQIYLNELEDKVMKYRSIYSDILTSKAVRIHLNPTVEENPVGPKKLMATAIAFFFSLFSGIVLALILEKVRS